MPVRDGRLNFWSFSMRGLCTALPGWFNALVLVGVLALAVPSGAQAVPLDDGTLSGSPATDVPIQLKASRQTDAAIQARLEKLFLTLPGLENVDIEVSSSVVTLTGEVFSKSAHRNALSLARRVEGVVDVQNQIVESRDVKTRLALAYQQSITRIFHLLDFLPLVLVALVILLVFWWASQWLARGHWLQRRFGSNPFLQDLAGQMIRVGVMGVGVLIALDIMDATTLVGSLLGAAGVVGLAIGFALRDTVENYVASLLLSLRQPFDRDDLVCIDGFEGRVLRLTSRATLLMTLDGNHTRIPNAKVFKAVIVNYTRNPKRRFDFEVGVDNEQDLAAAQKVATHTLVQMAGVLKDPAPICTVQQLGDSNVVLHVFGWVDQTHADFGMVRSEAIRLVKHAFDLAGIVMPEPIYNVRLGSLSGVGSSAALTQDVPAPNAVTPSSGLPPRPGASRGIAVDISPRDELSHQIAADRVASDVDSLSASAPKE